MTEFRGGGCISKDTQQDSLFYSNPVSRRKRGHGIRRSRNNRKKSGVNFMNASEVLDHLTRLFEAGSFSDFYRKLRSIRNDTLKVIYKLLLDVNSNFACVFTSFFFWRFGKSKDNSPTTERATLVINLTSRKIDSLNIPSLVSKKEVLELIPDSLAQKMPFRIFYKLRPPIALQFCNYSKFLKELSLDMIKSICESTCACSDYKDFISDYHDHVFTGDLNFVQDIDLRKIMEFGAKFRINMPVSWSKIFESLQEDFELNLRKLSRRFKISIDALRPWCDKVTDKVKDKIKQLENNGYRERSYISPKSFSILKTAITKLQKNFIISTVDKASNNFVFVCKKFYVLVLLKELGFNDNFLPIGNITYSTVKDTKEKIIERHAHELANIFNINIGNDNRILPKLFWIPKLHKSPYKFRFIAGARNCTTKPLSVTINLGLKVVKENFRMYCEAIFRNSGYNYFWSINSTLEFMYKINKIAVHSVQVFDFSTLYTNIDQTKILEHLVAIFKLVFNNSRRKYLCIRYDKAFFASRTYPSYACFDLDLFVKAVSFVIKEVYVTFGGLVFKQTKGIPMGGNCSPLLADLFLCHCEFSYMSSLVKNKKFGLAKLLSNTSRYIDDLCIVNYKHFHLLIDSIYPKDLIAERNGDDDKNADYLDVKINIGKVLHTSVFHKVDNFSFPVILLTFPESLIPTHLGYHVFAGQVLRYLRICSHLEDFIIKTKRTRDLLINRGYNPAYLKFQMEKILTKNSSLLHKFNLFSARQISASFEVCSLHND